ncbi:MAG: alpha/beta hydrolase [Microthrixaceae bacterium]
MRNSSHPVDKGVRPGRNLLGRMKPAAVSVALILVILASSASSLAAVPAPNASVGMPIANGTTEIPYGPLRDHRLDIYRTARPASRGTIVFIHGGGFTTGDKSEIREVIWAPILAERDNGFDVVSINYRLASVAPYPAAFDDAALAVSWVMTHGASQGLDTGRVIVVGHSAGGALAAMVGTRPDATTHFGSVPRVDSWVGIAPLLDFRTDEQIGHDFPADWGLSGQIERAFSSPLASLDATDPPGYLIHGDHDTVVSVRQSDMFALMGAASGADVRYDRVDFDPLGRPPAECLWHLPLCAADMVQFDDWLLHRPV